MSFQRARSEEQIQERVQEIINATSVLYNSVGYEGLSFSAISENTKFTRPTIYKYFKTKDEILLEILLVDIKSWISSLHKSFKINKIYSVEEIAEIWINSLMEHSRLLELYSILFTAIEKNVSIEALAKFKKESLNYQAPLIELTAQLFPNASQSNIINFIIYQLTLAFGLYPMCNLTSLQIDAIQLSGTNYQTPDFKKTYKSCIYQLMYCLENGIDIKN